MQNMIWRLRRWTTHSGSCWRNAKWTLSGNALLPLLYHSFKPQGVYLWGMYCKRSGIDAMYEIKKKLYDALAQRDLPAAQEQTRTVLDIAMNELSFYGA